MKFTENEYTELKKSTGELKEGIISIAAILNKHGKGILYFGIKNDGTLLGHDIGENTLRKISQAITNHIEPKIYPEITTEKTDNLHFIKVSFSGDDKPYFAYGRVYLRVADEDKLLTSREIEKLILEKNIYQSQWDSKLTGHSFLQTNPEAVNEFIEQLKNSGRTPVKSENPVDVLKKLGLIREKKLSYAAWHLFCDEQPVEWQMAVFKGNDKTEFTDFKPPFKGNLFFLLEKAIVFVTDKLNWRVEFGADMKRHEIPEIPMTALREAIVNSLVHRDYNDPKLNEIAFFADRIEIFNPGTFPKGLSPDDFIKGHERSHLRNPKIAEVFYYTKNIDRWGSGLQRIDKECKENNIRYDFKELSNGFLVIFYRSQADVKTVIEKSDEKFEEFSVEITQKVEELLNKLGIKWSEESVEKVGKRLVEKVGRKLAENQIKILLLVINNSRISKREMSELLNISTTAIDKNIEKLKKHGFLKRIGPAKGGYWKVLNNE